jgi:hypothetical protein
MLSGLILTAALLVPATGDTEVAQGGVPSVAVPQVPAPGAQPDPSMTPTGVAGDATAGQERPSLTDTHLGPPDDLWAEVDYRLYWLRPAPLNQALVTTPGQANALIGGQDVEYGKMNGYGVGAGMWLNERHTFGVGAGGFMIEQRKRFAAVNSDAAGSPRLARPFTDALLARPAELFVADPGRFAGGAFAASGARLSGLELYAIRNLYYHCGHRLDFLVGGKYLDLDEFLEFTQVTRPLGAATFQFGGVPFGAGNVLTLTDRFRTRNQFYGGVVGLRGEYRLGFGFLSLGAKLGLGNNHQSIDVDGRSSVSGPAVSVAPLPGGLYAVQGANLGHQTVNRFALLTEVGAQFGVQVTKRVKVTAGYDFIYLNNTARPGPQIDPVINTRLLPTSPLFGTLSGLTSPVPTGAREDFYAHGIRLGAEIGF